MFAGPLGALGGFLDAKAGLKDMWRTVDCSALGEHSLAWLA